MTKQEINEKQLRLIGNPKMKTRKNQQTIASIKHISQA
jgi:hypothetical protein